MPLEQKYLDLIRVAVPGVDEEKVLNRLSGLFDLVVETNQRINITSLVSPIDVTLKHLIDSLTLLSVPEVKSVLKTHTEFMYVHYSQTCLTVPVYSSQLYLKLEESTQAYF